MDAEFRCLFLFCFVLFWVVLFGLFGLFVSVSVSVFVFVCLCVCVFVCLCVFDAVIQTMCLCQHLRRT